MVSVNIYYKEHKPSHLLIRRQLIIVPNTNVGNEKPGSGKQTPIATHLFEDKIELVRVLKELDELDYVWVSLAVVEGLHLAEHPGAGVPRYLVDYLHSVFLPRVNVDARLYRRVRAFAQHLACQLVQVWNKIFSQYIYFLI